MNVWRVEQATFQLPVGTATFMLTDIEGSIRLWDSIPHAMGGAVCRHYELLDEAITRHGGVRPLEQGEGDHVVAASPAPRTRWPPRSTSSAPFRPRVGPKGCP
ncbi:MAG: adenylate/guanylate cyclase domain-containing protein [Pseudonocardiales bacterium]|nr:adenylate/guanylate cyclase domain-containing protein [Pseudonocardiales bacterium]